MDVHSTTRTLSCSSNTAILISQFERNELICPRIILELTVVILRSEIRVSVLEPDVSDLTSAGTDVLAVGGVGGFEPARSIRMHIRLEHEAQTMAEPLGMVASSSL